VLRDALIGAALGCVTTLPLVWKWRLGLRRTVPAVALLALPAAGAAAAIADLAGLGGSAVAGLAWLLTLLLAGAAVAYRFYRDPERRAPAADDVVVSPADGEVLYVRRSSGGVLPVADKHGRSYALHELTKTELCDHDAVVIGVGLSLLDVHVNRAPIGGRITLVRRFPGRFGSLRRPEMVFENERATMVIERGGLQIAVVMIASRLVRRIVAFIAEGDEVAAGQRLGVIRFGSQVDLVVPVREGLHVTVRPGEHVRAGESIVAVRARRPAPRGGESARSVAEAQ
jgi:phosphatidylserine decarboxylase